MPDSSSVPTRGRTLDHAAAVYDFVEPLIMLGKQAEYERDIVNLLALRPSDRVLDLGCGLGLTALVAQSLGAKVIGVDYEPAALAYAAKNAVANGIASPLWVAMDWRFPAIKAKSCSCIWGGDIMYERRFVLPVLDFMEHALEPGGVMWVAEPDRGIYGLFRQTLETRGWASRRIYQEKVPSLHLQESLVTVNLWEIARKG